jgi:EpsD family peptidyl-prolyl cis-trans isomerase
MPLRSRIVSFCASIVIIGLLAGCGKKNSSEGDAGGQVVARIGDTEATTQELDNEFRVAGVSQDKETGELTRAALKRIVLRKYLVQQAIAAKLDRQPTIHLDILRWRENVLATAALEHDAYTKFGAAGNTEIAKFISNHPAQFAQRQTIRIDQITFAVDHNLPAVANAMKGMKSVDEIDKKLSEMKVPHARSIELIDGAAAPNKVAEAARLQTSDEVFLTVNRGSAIFFKPIGVEANPLIGDEARARALQMIRAQIMQDETSKAEKEASALVQYEGSYARLMAGAPADKKGTAK